MTPTLAWGEIVWRGDFETGDRSQYTRAQMVSADRLEVVTSPVAEGRYALKATVRQGDDPINSSGNRNELVYMGGEKEGSEYYYRWKVMFAEDYPSAKTWQLFTQWHHTGCCGSPPVEFVVNGEQMLLSLNSSGAPWSTKLVRGVWHEFIFHVKWSSNAKVGFVELWHNGELVLPKFHAATMYAGDGIYLKLGLYRNETIKPVGVVYHDGLIQATKLEDVLSPVADPGTDEEPPGTEPGTDEEPPGTEPGTDEETPGTDEETPGTDEETPGTEPGAPATDEGTPTPGEDSEPADGSTPEVPGQTTPPTNATEPPAEEQPRQGCSATGGPLVALALLGLAGAARICRRR